VIRRPSEAGQTKRSKTGFLAEPAGLCEVKTQLAMR
jgi:hypothetical protein